MNLIEIRQLLNSEIKQAVQIWLEASIKTHHFIDPAFWESKVKDMETVWLPAAENTAILKDKRLIGFSSLVNDRLAAIFIHRDEQGNGYGTLLLNKVKQRRKRLELTVYEKNQTAITFYVKQGFRKTENRKDPATGEKEFVMVWTCLRAF
jgi:putative acetyltransferase